MGNNSGVVVFPNQSCLQGLSTEECVFFLSVALELYAKIWR